MQKLKHLRLLWITLLLLTPPLHAITYEDGEDKTTQRWLLHNKNMLSTINHIYDNQKKSNVIEFKGEGTKSTYLLSHKGSLSWNNRENKILQWKMNYHEDFVIIVSIATEDKDRYLIYTSGDHNSYMQYGLGESSNNGLWHTFERNLESDLQQYEKDNTIVAVNTFVIRGSGRIDDIKLLKFPSIKKEIKSNPYLTLNNYKTPSIQDNTPPVITLLGDHHIVLKKGQEFIEPGVKAIDNEDGEVMVTSTESINKNQEGRYLIIYLATDNHGNSAVKSRFVDIGNSPSNTFKSTTQTALSEEEKASEYLEETNQKEIQLQEHELEIEEWEEALKAREQELIERENSLKTNGILHQSIEIMR